jgi:hypothetical protein
VARFLSANWSTESISTDRDVRTADGLGYTGTGSLPASNSVLYAPETKTLVDGQFLTRDEVMQHRRHSDAYLRMGSAAFMLTQLTVATPRPRGKQPLARVV